MSAERRITKIKDADGKIIIHYQVIRPDERTDEYTLSCADAPRPEFREALNAIRPTLAQWCDVPPEWCESLTVFGVSLSWANDIMGATVTAKRPCSSSAPLILNAPHKPSMPYSEGGDHSVCLTEEQIVAIENMIEEAERYIEGNRAQMELPLEDGAEVKGEDASLEISINNKPVAKFKSVKEFSEATKKLAKAATA